MASGRHPGAGFLCVAEAARKPSAKGPPTPCGACLRCLRAPRGATADRVILQGWTIGTCIVRKVTDWLEKCLRSRIVATFCPKMTAFGRKRSGSEADNTCKRFRESDNKGLSLRKRPPAHENRTSKPSAPGPRKARMSSSYGSCRRARQCITGTQGRPRACLSNGWPDAAQFRRSR